MIVLLAIFHECMPLASSFAWDFSYIVRVEILFPASNAYQNGNWFVQRSLQYTKLCPCH